MGNCFSGNGSGYKQKNVKNIANLLLNGYLRIESDIYGMELSVKIKHTITNYYQSFGVIYGIGKNLAGQFGIGSPKPLTQFTKLQQMTYLFEGDIGNIYCNNNRIYIRTGHNALYVAGSKNKELEYIPFFIKYKQESIQCVSSSCKGCLHSIFMDNNGDLYGYGKNMYGAFGDGDVISYNYHNEWIPDTDNLDKLEIDVMNIFGNKGNIKQIVCGLKHTMFLCDNGKVYNCGDNEHAALGYIDGSDNNKLVPTLIDSFGDNINIIYICCGKHHNLCIDEEYRLWIFGNNTSNQLGVNNEREIYGARLHPYFEEKKINIKKVDCGECHTLCLNTNNICYGFGRNMFYEIGTGDQTKVRLPKEIVFYNDREDVDSALLQQHINIDDISCGQYHNVLLSKENEIICFGGNDYKQCSINHDEFVKTPYQLNKTKDIGIKENDVIIGVIAMVEETLIVIK